MDWYFDVLKKYVVFSGRARRKEYWFFVLFNLMIAVIMLMLDILLGIPVFYLIYVLATILPNLSVSVRRLHDTNRSGWWLLISLIPIVGIIVLLVFVSLEGTKGENRYGDDPIFSE